MIEIRIRQTIQKKSQHTMDSQRKVNPTNVIPFSGATIEPEAFAAIYDNFFPAVHKYILLRTSDAQIADDLTAQVFERLIKALQGYQAQKGAFEAWLFGIVRHIVNDHFRSLKRFPNLPFHSLLQKADPSPTPEKTLIFQERDNELLNALGCLNKRERELIAFKFSVELNNRQIAQLTGLSENNVSVILFRALRKLRDRMLEGKKNEREI